MAREGMLETVHLEAWITEHPEVIDPGLKVITTQFGRWTSASDTARERPDIIALSNSGELVVIELKRGADPRIHVQALTYGALAAGFTKDRLADAHAEWSSRRNEHLTSEEALQNLTNHVESEWSEEMLRLPRIVLVAETFPGQVLTTIQWLASVAPNITIECHEYRLFKDMANGTCVNFRRIFPIDDLQDRTLRPSAAEATGDLRDQIASNKRRTRSVTIIADHGAIPDGSPITLELETLVRPDVVTAVYRWLDEDPKRRDVRWISDPTKPLIWSAAEDPATRWTPSSLRNEIFIAVTGEAGKFSAADGWCYQGKNFYEIATSLLDSEVVD